MFEAEFGPVSWETLREYREQDRMRPFQGDPPTLEENDSFGLTVNLLRRLYDREYPDSVITEIMRFRRRIFVEVIESPDYLGDLLERLGTRFKLAVLSNYPDGDGIRESVDRIGMSRHFLSVVVSGDLGLVKPHPETFERALEAAGSRAEETIYIGDNWLADVQGSRRAGLTSVHTQQWAPPEHHPRCDGDLDPHLTIQHLTELPQWLGME